jgi:hypothetical protein
MVHYCASSELIGGLFDAGVADFALVLLFVCFEYQENIPNHLSSKSLLHY